MVRAARPPPSPPLARPRTRRVHLPRPQPSLPPPRPAPPSPPVPSPLCVAALLSRLPLLEALHLGNNQASEAQIVGLAATFLRLKLPRLNNLTVGSNDCGDGGIAALMKALPPSIKQLYLHGVDMTDVGIGHICAALPRFPELWGLGACARVHVALPRTSLARSHSLPAPAAR